VPLTPEEIDRYGRHLSLPQFGHAAQLKLKQSSVLIIGAGGLGSPVSLYLAAAGVGTLGLVDFDRVEVTNLQRQVLYGTSDIGQLKTEAAAARLRDLNPLIDVRLHEKELMASNVMNILSPYDVVVDGTDNFATRYLINDATVLLGKPNVHGSIFRFEGLASVFLAPEGPCYRCLYPQPPPAGLVPSCEEGGVLGVLPGVIGTIQAIETIKLLAGIGTTLVGRLLLFDALTMEFRQLTLKKDPECAVCGAEPTIRQPADLAISCEVSMSEQSEIEPAELRRRLSAGGIRLIDVREPHEWQLGHIEGAELIPLRSVPEAVERLGQDEEIVVYCHMGGRSARAAEFLREAGFTRVLNLTGGYGRWLTES
jgi:molybdopterin/thiamine biosynthesis adenylyltransferase/rhodanese-related sulfurtransferase